MKNIRTNRRRNKLKRLIAGVTAVSVVLGSTYFVMADEPSPIYICGMEEHTHTDVDGRCYDCVLEEEIKLAHEEGLEHEHGDGCYVTTDELKCTIEENHEHGESCYKDVKELSCTEAEHEHGEECAEGCDKAEHAHGDACYTTEKVLDCDIVEGHVHSDKCYKKELVCEKEEHECTYEECWVPAYEGAHKHGDGESCDRQLVCDKPEHKHVDACIQPEEVTEFLEKVDALNEKALLLQEAKEVYNEKAAEVAEIEAEGNAAKEAGEPQEVIDAIMERYLKADEEKAEAMDIMAEAQKLFNDEWGIVRLEYSQLGGEEHPEYKDMISAEQKNLIENGVPYGMDGIVEEEAAVFEVAREAGTSNESQNVTFNLFNYDSSILDYEILDFYDYGGANAVDTNQQSVSGSSGTFTVDEELNENGYPVIEKTTGNSWMGNQTTQSYSLEDLFNGEEASEAYYGVTGLLEQTGTHYTYDSKDNAAMFDGTKFVTYPFTVKPKLDQGKTYGKGNFLPFNNPNNNSNGYLTELNDMWFGMTMAFDFKMPENGMLESGEAMTFKFSGDDDVLVYIDNCLVIDLKGCHESETGTINFATGEVQTWDENGNARTPFNMYQKYATQYAEDLVTYTKADQTTGTRFGDYSTHTLKFFYLERGGMYSGCELDFDITTIPPHSLTVKKHVEADGVLGADAQEYKFRVVKAAADGTATNTLFIPDGTEFTINKGASTRSAEVGADGYFTLRHGEEAVFEELNELGAVTDKYIIQEVLPAAYSDAFNVYTPVGAGGTVTTKGTVDEFASLSTGAILNQKSRIVQFNNEVVTTKLGDLEITKTTKDDLTGPFDIQVLFGDMYGTATPNVPLAKDTEYTVTKADGTTETRTVGANGIIQLSKDETALITGILPGTRYLINEPDAEDDGFFPTFADGTANGVIPSAGTATESILNRATNFSTDRIKVTKVVKGLPLKAAFADTFNFKAELIDYAEPNAAPEAGSSEQGAVAQAFNALVELVTSFPDEVEDNVAAANGDDKKVSIPVSKKADENVASKTADGTLVLNFDKDTPNGVYTYKVKEVLSDAQKDVYAANRQEFTVKVKVDQSKEGDGRAEIIEMKLGSEDVTFLKFTNERIPEPITVGVRKVWDHTGNKGATPTSGVTVQLYVNEEAVGAPVALSETNNNWLHVWNDVVITDADTWKVVETATPKYYKDVTSTTTRPVTVETIGEESVQVWTVTNKYITQTPPGGGPGGGGDYGTLEITKQVVSNTTSGTIPEDAIFDMQVVLDGERIAEGTPYTVGTETRYVPEGKPGIIQLLDGETAVITLRAGTEYVVTEDSSGGLYFPTYSSNNEGEIKANESVTVTVQNRASAFSLPVEFSKTLFGALETGDYTFRFKVECEELGYTGEAEITVPVTAGEIDANRGKTVYGTITLPFKSEVANDDYNFVITEVSEDGFQADEATRTVKVEVAKSAAERASVVSVDGNENVKIAAFTNRAVKEVTVEKVWNTAGKQAPESVAVQLYVKDDASGEAAGLGLSTASGWKKSGEVVKLSEDNNWRYAWTLEKDLEWKVEEVEVAGHKTTDGGKTWVGKDTTYTTEIKYSNDKLAAKIENTRVVEKGTLTIEKVAKADSNFGDQKFDVEVTLNDAKVAKDTAYTLYNAKGETSSAAVAKDGHIELAVGEKAVFEVDANTTYTVSEAHKGGYFATYQKNGSNVEGRAEGTVLEGKSEFVQITNQTDKFGVVLNLVKQAFGLAEDTEYEFFFDMVREGNDARETTSIEVKGPKAVVSDGDVPVAAAEEFATGTGAFKLNFDKKTPSGTYIYVVTERPEAVAEGTDPVFEPNTQKYTVTVVVDQDAKDVDQTAGFRAQITSVKDENGNELINAKNVTEVPLTFINTTVPKQFVTVNKVWNNVTDNTRPANVKVQLYVNDEAKYEPVVLNAENGWTYTWAIEDYDATTWSVKEVAVDGHVAANDDGTKWTAEGTTAYFTTAIAQAGDVATITNTRVVPSSGGGGGGGSYTPPTPPVNIDDEDTPLSGGSVEEDGDVLGAEDVVLKEEEEGMVLGAEDEEEGMVAGIADTGDSKTIIFASVGMLAALGAIFALRKKED